jgi:hypothetical protein
MVTVGGVSGEMSVWAASGVAVEPAAPRSLTPGKPCRLHALAPLFLRLTTISLLTPVEATLTPRLLVLQGETAAVVRLAVVRLCLAEAAGEGDVPARVEAVESG